MSVRQALGPTVVCGERFRPGGVFSVQRPFVDATPVASAPRHLVPGPSAPPGLAAQQDT